MKYLSFLETIRSFWRRFNIPMTFYYFGDFVLLHNKETIIRRYPRELNSKLHVTNILVVSPIPHFSI